DGGVGTVTTIEISHPGLSARGIFEYQHSFGNNLEDALGKGFEQWLQVDFVVLLDALRDQPEHCTMMEMTFAEPAGSPAKRRAVLGPVAHLATQPLPAKPEKRDS